MSGLPVNLNVPGSEGVVVPLLARWLMQSGCVFIYVPIRAVFRANEGRNRFLVESWAGSNDLAANEVRWKAAVRKKPMGLEKRRMIALEVAREADLDRTWGAVRHVEESRRAMDNDQTKFVDIALNAHKFKTTLQH